MLRNVVILLFCSAYPFVYTYGPYSSLLDEGKVSGDEKIFQQTKYTVSGGSTIIRFPGIGNYDYPVTHITVQTKNFATLTAARLIGGGPGYGFANILVAGSDNVPYEVVITIEGVVSANYVTARPDFYSEDENRYDHQFPNAPSSDRIRLLLFRSGARQNWESKRPPSRAQALKGQPNNEYNHRNHENNPSQENDRGYSHSALNKQVDNIYRPVYAESRSDSNQASDESDSQESSEEDNYSEYETNRNNDNDPKKLDTVRFINQHKSSSFAKVKVNDQAEAKGRKILEYPIPKTARYQSDPRFEENQEDFNSESEAAKETLDPRLYETFKLLKPHLYGSIPEETLNSRPELNRRIHWSDNFANDAVMEQEVYDISRKSDYPTNSNVRDISYDNNDVSAIIYK